MQETISNSKDQKSNIRNEFKARLYAFTLRLVGLIDAMPNDKVAYRIGDQLLRSGTSIIGNYVEGRAASSRKDFTNFLNISLKSANESKLWLALLRDSNRIKREEAHWFLCELDAISKILASSILTLKGRNGLYQKSNIKYQR